MTNTNMNPTASTPHYHAADPYYHANAKGTGSAIKFELHPAHDDTPGSIFVSLAMQKTVGTLQGGTQIFPTFDWKNRISLKLDRTDLSQILQVLRGMQESILDGKGLYHTSPTGNSIIKFAHQIDPRPGYMLSVWKKLPSGEQMNAYFIFDVNEAFTLMLALERAMMYVCFGIPEVIERPAPRSMEQPIPPQPVPVPVPVPASAPESEFLAASGDPF